MSLRDSSMKDRNIKGIPVIDYGWSSKVYYSKTLPKGKAPDYTPSDYNYKLLDDMLLVKDFILANQAKAVTNKHGHTNYQRVKGYDEFGFYVIPIQKELIKMGYLDPGDDDGIFGKKTEGAIKRYNYNKPTWTEEAWHWIKGYDTNLYD